MKNGVGISVLVMAMGVSLAIGGLLGFGISVLASEKSPPSASGGGGDLPPVQAQPTAAAPVALPAKYEQIGGVDDVPLVQDGPGVWRFYDEDAQVVCYIYGANHVDFGSWSGVSCLPASETHIGQ